MNIQEQDYKKVAEEAKRKKIEDKKIVYEWMYLLKNCKHWRVSLQLMTDDEAAEWFTMSRKIVYKKTGREFIVDVNTAEAKEV